jgi:hypothetical protein
VNHKVVEQMLGAARDINAGTNPERSTAAGVAMVRNVMIAIADGAIAGVALKYPSLVPG